MEFELGLGILAIILFWFKNPQKKFIVFISIFVLGLFISQFIFLIGLNNPSQTIWIVSTLGLLILYPLRFKDKDEKKAIDYIKLIGLFILIIYPLPFYHYFNIESNNSIVVLRTSTFMIVGTIYIYDRWILKQDNMKRKHLIIIVGQTFLILLMMIYAFFQKAVADEQTLLAQENLYKAKQNEEQCRALIKELEEKQN